MTSSSFRIAVGCSVGLFVPLLIPLVIGGVFPLNDLGVYHIPFRFLYSEALQHGDSVLWTPAVFAGYYVFGEGQLGMAHPWHLLLYRWLPLVPAFNIELIASYVVMFAGAVLLFRRIGLPRESRWFGAMVFTFSGYNVFHVIHPNIIAVAAHIPWLLLAADALIAADDRKAQARAFIAVALIFASQLLAGHPQQVWLGLIVMGSMCLYLLWSNLAVGRIARLVPALGVGALVAGVQLLPLLDVLATSQRTEWSPYASLTYSLLPSNIVQLWSPFLFHDGVRTISIERDAIHEFVVYNGAFCTVALVWIALRWRSLRRKRLAGGLLILASVSLLLAFGRYGGLYTSLLALPVLRWFRAPARHLMIFHLSLSALAAIAFEDLVDLLRRGERLAVRRLWPLAIPFALSVVSMIVASILVTLRSSEPLSRIAATAPWAALFVVVPLLFTAAARGRSWAIPLLILVTACDQGYWGFRYIYSTQPSPILTLDQLAQAVDVPAAAQPGDLIDSKKTEGLDNMPILRGFRVWPGYVGLVPAMVLPFGNEEVAAQRIAGVKWRVSMPAAPQPVPDPAPRVRLLTNATVSANIPKDVHDIDILSEALVQVPLEGLSGPPGTARILEDRPGRIVVETTAPAPQLLVVTERFHPGWRVSEGETEIEPVPVYGDFLGCVVPAGTHQLTFRFKPKSFQYGLLTTGVGLLIVLSLIPFAI